MQPRKLRVHFHVPADKVPAPHHVSGTTDTPVGKLGSGRGHVMACNPDIVASEFDLATGEPWAVACADCVKTAAWLEAAKANPHPRLANARPTEAEDVSEAIRGCCG